MRKDADERKVQGPFETKGPPSILPRQASVDPTKTKGAERSTAA